MAGSKEAKQLTLDSWRKRSRDQKENAALRDQLAKETNGIYNGLRFEEMLRLLLFEKIDISPFTESAAKAISETATEFGDAEPRLLHLLWYNRQELAMGDNVSLEDPTQRTCPVRAYKL